MAPGNHDSWQVDQSTSTFFHSKRKKAKLAKQGPLSSLRDRADQPLQNSLQINSLNELRDFIDKTYQFQQAYNKSKQGALKAGSRVHQYGHINYTIQHQQEETPQSTTYVEDELGQQNEQLVQIEMPFLNLQNDAVARSKAARKKEQGIQIEHRRKDLNYSVQPTIVSVGALNPENLWPHGHASYQRTSKKQLRKVLGQSLERGQLGSLRHLKSKRHLKSPKHKYLHTKFMGFPTIGGKRPKVSLSVNIGKNFLGRVGDDTLSN